MACLIELTEISEIDNEELGTVVVNMDQVSHFFTSKGSIKGSIIYANGQDLYVLENIKTIRSMAIDRDNNHGY